MSMQLVMPQTLTKVGVAFILLEHDFCTKTTQRAQHGTIAEYTIPDRIVKRIPTMG